MADTLTPSEKQEQAVSYAALILQDQSLDITSDKLVAIAKAAGVEVQPTFANIFAKVLSGRDISDLLVAAASGGGGGGGGGAAAGSDDAAAAVAAEPEPEPEEESSSEEMELDLFG